MSPRSRLLNGIEGGNAAAIERLLVLDTFFDRHAKREAMWKRALDPRNVTFFKSAVKAPYQSAFITEWR